jgi:hypothetical protein
MRPYFIEQRLKLRTPIYSETAAYGHMGRKNEVVDEDLYFNQDGKARTMKVELFHLGEIRLSNQTQISSFGNSKKIKR